MDGCPTVEMGTHRSDSELLCDEQANFVDALGRNRTVEEERLNLLASIHLVVVYEEEAEAVDICCEFSKNISDDIPQVACDLTARSPDFVG